MNPPTHDTTPSSGETSARGDHEAGEHPVSATLLLLPLQQEEEPRFRWQTKLTASEGAGPNARLRVRTRLTVARWPGNIDAAARVADKLVDNAVRHAKPFGPGEGWIELRLTLLPGTDELLIEVDDAAAEFADFNTAVSAEPSGRPPGLWWIRHCQGTLSWDQKTDDTTGNVVGKTVTALLPTTWGPA
ncbi:hypothetical protein [Streptomyces sp. NPDC005209]|uniref:hypothetical protein n=1 Tax=Streptomyces sp. NPDC005209 TaxID=3156715 RepID=UPI0033A55C0E